MSSNDKLDPSKPPSDVLGLLWGRDVVGLLFPALEFSSVLFFLAVSRSMMACTSFDGLRGIPAFLFCQLHTGAVSLGGVGSLTSRSNLSSRSAVAARLRQVSAHILRVSVAD